MKLILFIPATGLLFAGISHFGKTPESNPTTQTKPASTTQTVSTETAPLMWASNTTLYQGESFGLHFKTPHAQYLGVIDPNGKFFYVVFPAEDASGKLQPLVSSEDFERLKSLKISTKTLKADPYIYGVYENKPVFTKSGAYRFVMGDDLHVDDESLLQTVKINYRHSARPAPAEPVIAAN